MCQCCVDGPHDDWRHTDIARDGFEGLICNKCDKYNCAYSCPACRELCKCDDFIDL
jgi:hypothetical protein